jgi:CheY-like chemotaxis protein
MAGVQIISSDREKRAALTAALERAGYEVAASSMSEDLRRQLKAAPPGAIVIDLERAPATGRDLGLYLRVQSATRRCTLLFLDGKPEKVAEIRELLPDACYSTGGTLVEDLEHGLQNQPARPVVPASVFAGYSGRPLPAKLGLKPGMMVALIDAPDEFEALLRPLPENVQLARGGCTSPDLTLWFTTSVDALTADLPNRLQQARPGNIWIIWPKRSSAQGSDLTQALVRKAGLEANWVDFKVCAVDQTWTALCFTARKEK